MDESDTQTITPAEPEERPLPTPVFRHVARVIFTVFILTFVTSRVMVILIMSGKVHDFYFHVGKAQTHIHHLNYGIFTLSGVGAYLLFRRPSGTRLTLATIVYAIGLGLTFDEFGMWVKLGGSYWQKASVDAVIIIAAAFGLLAFLPPPSKFKTQHWISLAAVVIVAGAFMLALGLSLTHLADRWAPWLHNIEETGPQ